MVEPTRSRTDPALGGNFSGNKKRFDLIESQSRISVTDMVNRTTPSQAVLMSRPVLNRERSEPTLERRLVVQPTLVHASHAAQFQPIQGPSESDNMERRLSIPNVNSSSAVITASLRISVAAGDMSGVRPSSSSMVGKSFTVENDHDIPFIEENSLSQDESSLTNKSSGSERTARQRTSHTSLKSSAQTGNAAVTVDQSQPDPTQWSTTNDSYLGQPLTGSMQVVASSNATATALPAVKATIQGQKNTSQDSMLSAATFKPSTVTQLSPLQSPRTAHINQRRRSGDVTGLDRTASVPTAGVGVVRSKTTDLERIVGVGRSHPVTLAAKEEWLKRDRLRNTNASTTPSTAANAVAIAADAEEAALKRKAKKKYTGLRNHTDYLPSAAVRQFTSSVDPVASSQSRMTSVLRKRWEIIASNPDGPETLVWNVTSFILSHIVCACECVCARARVYVCVLVGAWANLFLPARPPILRRCIVLSTCGPFLSYPP